MSVEYLGLSAFSKPDIKSIWRKGYKIGNILNYDPLKDRYVLAAFTKDLAIKNTFHIHWKHIFEIVLKSSVESILTSDIGIYW